MKKLLIVSLLFITLANSFGQWYVKKYNVNDINLLKENELNESLKDAKTGMLVSGIVAGMGGLTMVLFKYGKPGMSEDPGVIEQLMGDEGVNTAGFYTGAAILAGGAIASIAYLGRIARINSVMKKKYPAFGELNMSPAGVYNSSTKSFSPGFTLTYKF
jgi:hypothetical protein